MKRRVTRRGAGAALALVVSVLGLAPVDGWARETEVGDGTGGHLTPRSSLRDLLNHPAFAGFADLLLPWDDRAYDGTLPLTDIGSLLPYHSHVDPETVTGALNRMIEEISRRGYNAFVLRYRAGHGGTVATQDLAAALSFIFANAKALGVSPSDYSLWGSSAGARMAASVGSHGVEPFGGGKLPRPAVVVMAYTGHSDHSSNEPPTFVVVGERDGIAPPTVVERRVATLRRSGTDVEYRRYPNLGHGFGTGVGTSAEGLDRGRHQVLGEVHPKAELR